jgi:hypothetical protein
MCFFNYKETQTLSKMPLYGSIQGSYGISRAPWVLAGKSILIIYDIATSDTMALVDYLNSYRIRTQLVPRNTYIGTNPPPSRYTAVIMLDGTTYTQDLDTGAQLALKNYVSGGGKFITSEWDAYQVNRGRLASMTDLVLLTRNSAKTQAVTYQIDPVYASHPIFNGFTNTIAMPLTSYNQGPITVFGSQPVSRLAWHQGDPEEPAIAVRTYGIGKVVHFSFAGGNYFSGVLSNANVLKLMYNAVMW